MKFTNVLAAGVLALGLGAGLAACGNDGPATISSKYNCTQTVNGHTQKAYCVQDSNGQNFYVSYYIWLRMVTGQNEDKYLPSSYTNSTRYQPPEEDIPAEYHPAPVEEPVHEAPVEEPVHVSEG